MSDKVAWTILTVSFVNSVANSARVHSGFTHETLKRIILSQRSNENDTCHVSAVSELAQSENRESTNNADSIYTCNDGVIKIETETSEHNWSCSNIDLYSHLWLPDLGCEPHATWNLDTTGVCWGSDLWGWTDSVEGAEYVLTTMLSGTTLVNIKDPLKPYILAVVESPDSKGTYWKDVKTYQDWAYVIMDASESHAIQYFHLPTVISKAQQYYQDENIDVSTKSTDVYYELSNDDPDVQQNKDLNITGCHNLFINEKTGYLYAMGCSFFNKTYRASGRKFIADGGFVVFDLKSDGIPQVVATFGEDGYVHDTQCVVYKGEDIRYLNKEVCFAFNEDAITIVNMEDKNNIEIISTFSYEGAAYVHQGWLDSSHKYLFTNDELDEYNNPSDPYPITYIFDVRDLENPKIMLSSNEENFASTTHTSIDHNHYVVGNYLYQAHYEAGLRIIDISEFLNSDGSVHCSGDSLNEVAYFDTYVTDDNVCFNGAWGVYPFFQSGVIAVSDVVNGLFLLKFNQPKKKITSSGKSKLWSKSWSHRPRSRKTGSSWWKQNCVTY